MYAYLPLDDKFLKFNHILFTYTQTYYAKCSIFLKYNWNMGHDTFTKHNQCF